LETNKKFYVCPGNIETRENRPGQISRNVELRNELDLFTYIMNCKSFPGIQTRHKDIVKPTFNLSGLLLLVYIIFYFIGYYPYQAKHRRRVCHVRA